MTWIVEGRARDRNIFSKKFDQLIPVAYAFEDREGLMIHLLKSGRLGDLPFTMLDKVLTPQAFVEFLASHPSRTCREALDEVYEDIASAIIREYDTLLTEGTPLAIEEGRAVLYCGEVVATWVSENEEVAE